MGHRKDVSELPEAVQVHVREFAEDLKHFRRDTLHLGICGFARRISKHGHCSPQLISYLERSKGSPSKRFCQALQATFPGRLDSIRHLRYFDTRGHP